MNTVSWVIVVAVFLGSRVLQEWNTRRRIKAAVTEANTNTERAFVEGTKMLAEQHATLQVELERAREVAQDERDRTSRYFAQIQVFEKQRDEWQRRYFDQSAGHGNAQSLMMATIERLARDLQAKGGRPQIPKVLHAVREEFLQTHELPAREGAAALKETLRPAPEIATDTEAPVAS